MVVAADRASARVCIGDCDRDDRVELSEMVRGVNLALGVRPMQDCPAFDADQSGAVGIDELI